MRTNHSSSDFQSFLFLLRMCLRKGLRPTCQRHKHSLQPNSKASCIMFLSLQGQAINKRKLWREKIDLRSNSYCLSWQQYLQDRTSTKMTIVPITFTAVDTSRSHIMPSLNVPHQRNSRPLVIATNSYYNIKRDQSRVVIGTQIDVILPKVSY